LLNIRIKGIFNNLCQLISTFINEHRISRCKAYFIERNRAFWTARMSADIGGESVGFVFVRLESMSIILIQLCNAFFGMVASLALRCKPLFVVDHRKNRIVPVLKSFPGASFIFIDELLAKDVDALEVKKEAAEAYRQLQAPSQILDFRVDGIYLGDVIYDVALAKGYATVSQVDERIQKVLEEFYLQRAVVKIIMAKYNLKSSVFSHVVDIQGATFSRYLLRSGVQVLTRVGAYQFVIKKYLSLEDVGSFPLRPEDKYFDMMSRDDDGQMMIEAVDSYIEGRFYSEINHPAVDLAYSDEKITYMDREAFCNKYHLNPKLPLVFVMMHAFNDYPHSHFKRRLMFQDYFHWFETTIRLAKEIKSVNWIFKAHPADRYYQTKDLNLDLYFQTISEPNIVFLNSSSDFNSRSLMYIAHAIITCLGTAGLEFATQGIPCVLGGESPYSGFGFTAEPVNITEYSEILKDIADIQPLSKEQVRLAKLVTYFYFCAVMGSHFRFCPYFDDNQIFLWGNKEELMFWKKVSDQFLSQPHMLQLEQQVTTLAKFVRDPSWTQYVEDERFMHDDEES
jgi:hypothetical protein